MKFSEIKNVSINNSTSCVAFDTGIQVADDKLTLTNTPCMYPLGIDGSGFKLFKRYRTKEIDLTNLPDGNLWLGTDIDGSTKYMLEKNKPFNVDEDPIWYRHQQWLDVRNNMQINCTGDYLEDDKDPFGDGKLNNFWKLNGDATDEEGNDDGTLHGDADFIDMDTPIRDGGKVLDLDGDGDYVSTDFKIGTQSQYTLSTLINYDDTSGIQTVLASVDSDNTAEKKRGIIEISNGNVIQLYMGDDSNSSNINVSISQLKTNTWYFISIVIDGSNQTLFINDKKVGTYTLDVSAGTSSDYTYSIGRLGESDNNYFNGQIAQTKIFLDKALTDLEVIEMYNEQKKQFEPIEKPISYLPYKIEISDEKAKSIVKDDKLFDNVLCSTDIKGNVNIKGNIDTNGGIVSGKNQCTAWVNFDGTNATIRDSFNVSSVLRNGTGSYTVYFEDEMSNVGFSKVGSSAITTSESTLIVTFDNNVVIDKINVRIHNENGDAKDSEYIYIQVFGGKN